MSKKNPAIVIIGGKGKMGAWFANFFTSHELFVTTIGRTTPAKMKKIVHAADIIIVSVPIGETEKVIALCAAAMRKDALLADITSLKIMPMKAMEKAIGATLGMHPLFGPSISLMQGQKIVFCKQKNNAHVDFLQELFTKAGMEIIFMTAEEHDYHMAYVQGLTHALNLLYAKILFDQGELSQKLTTPLFSLQSLVMGRVLHQNLSLSADIQMYNPYFMPLLENLSGYSKQLLSILQAGKKKDFLRLFQDEKQQGREYANFSQLHTDKILQLVSEVKGTLPEKIAVTNIPTDATIAYLGPKGTYSHTATDIVFAKKSFKKIPCETLYGVFTKVLTGDADFGIVPAENSIEGTVKGTIDYLVDFSLHVVGSFELPIHHQLASVEKNLRDIKTVYSHPQAIAQCEQWLRAHLPSAKIIPTASTSTALLQKKRHEGYICSEPAAKLFKIPIIAKNIEDNPKNTTRFYAIAKKQIKVSGLSNEKTLLFLTIYNRVGILRDILNVFANYGLNLTKLESRPSYEKVWDYHFFVELNTEYKSQELQEAIVELEKHCPVIRILGQT